jgi:hypothetical protein
MIIYDRQPPTSPRRARLMSALVKIPGENGASRRTGLMSALGAPPQCAGAVAAVARPTPLAIYGANPGKTSPAPVARLMAIYGRSGSATYERLSENPGRKRPYPPDGTYERLSAHP